MVFPSHPSPIEKDYQIVISARLFPAFPFQPFLVLELETTIKKTALMQCPQE